MKSEEALEGDKTAGSLPVWECGLKSEKIRKRKELVRVTPRVGVWIEIMHKEYAKAEGLVTPRVGVWIEIYVIGYKGYGFKSLPVWECGLKSGRRGDAVSAVGHSPCGSVD